MRNEKETKSQKESRKRIKTNDCHKYFIKTLKWKTTCRILNPSNLTGTTFEYSTKLLGNTRVTWTIFFSDNVEDSENTKKLKNYKPNA